MGLSIQGSVTIRQGEDWLRIDAAQRRVEVRTGSWRTLRDLAAILEQVRVAVKGGRPKRGTDTPPSDGPMRRARERAVSGAESLTGAAGRVRDAGFTVRLFIADRLVAEVGPDIEPNLPARLARLTPMRIHAMPLVRAWLGR